MKDCASSAIPRTATTVEDCAIKAPRDYPWAAVQRAMAVPAMATHLRSKTVEKLRVKGRHVTKHQLAPLRDQIDTDRRGSGVHPNAQSDTDDE
jgi:hypothetical protein